MVATGRPLAVGKQAVNSLPLSVSSFWILMGHALCRALRNALAQAAVLFPFVATKKPARGPVYGDKQVTPRCHILHVEQILHIRMQVPRLISPESFVGLLGRSGLWGVEVAHSMAALTPVKARARDAWADELLGDGHPVIQRQQQSAAQVHHHSLLTLGQLGLQAMRGVRAISKVGTLFHLWAVVQ